MAKGIFRNVALETLLAWKSSIETKLTADPLLLLTSTSVGSSSASKTPIMQLDQMLDEINYALELKSPGTYAPKKYKSKVEFK